MFQNSDFRKIRLETLFVFLKLVEFESFSKVAKYMNKTQGAISQQLIDFEKNLNNVKLINRTSQKFQLTSHGRFIYKSLVPIVNDLEELFDNLHLISNSDKYLIRIISSSIPGEYILPKKMLEFQQVYINSHFSIEITNSQSAIKALLENEVSLCAIGGFLDQIPNQFEKKELFSDSIVIIARKDHPIFNSKMTLKDLYQYPWVFREKGSATRDIFLSKIPNKEKLSIVLEIQDNMAIINAVKASNALSAISTNFIQFNKNSEISVVNLPNFSPIKRKIHLLRNKNIKLKKIEQSFWNFC